MPTAKEMSDEILKEYEFILTIKRKSDGHELGMSFSNLPEVMNIDFMSQIIGHIKKHEGDSLLPTVTDKELKGE